MVNYSQSDLNLAVEFKSKKVPSPITASGIPIHSSKLAPPYRKCKISAKIGVTLYKFECPCLDLGSNPRITRLEPSHGREEEDITAGPGLCNQPTYNQLFLDTDIILFVYTTSPHQKIPQ